MQKILSDAHSNFSVFGLAFTFALGSLMIAICFMLESPPGFLRKRFGSNAYWRLEWATNGTLQLQRLAHEELGFGTWRGCTQDVPTTRHGEKLALLDVTNVNHPSLKARSSAAVESTASQDDSREKLEPVRIEDAAGARL